MSADSWRLRAGVEASRRIPLGQEGWLEPFLEAAARQDGGDALAGSGMELAGGMRYGAPGVAVEVRGRWLALHAEEGAEEKGVSLTARAGPGVDGQGWFFAFHPQWGSTTGGADALWGEALPSLSIAGSSGGGVDAEVGYGYGLAHGGLLTPFAQAGLSATDGRHLTLGTRFASNGALEWEVTGERREGGATAELLLRLYGQHRF
ncbi:MAG: hypothetical protein F4094_03355 [Synechococcus sp. SB0672_bin_6]|nr:hypothetical protein [Synechococcus sp. SB0672_bin_6]